MAEAGSARARPPKRPRAARQHDVFDCKACGEPCLAIGTMSVCGCQVCGVCTTRASSLDTATLGGHFCCPVHGCPPAPQGCTFIRKVAGNPAGNPISAPAVGESEDEGALEKGTPVARLTRAAARLGAAAALAELMTDDKTDEDTDENVGTLPCFIGILEPGRVWRVFSATPNADTEVVVAVAAAMSGVLYPTNQRVLVGEVGHDDGSVA